MHQCGVTSLKTSVYDWPCIDSAINSLFSDIFSSNWRPDITVGITPDSAVFSNILSNRLETQYETIKIDISEHQSDIELNLWLPELAFGVNDSSSSGITNARWDPALRKNILVCVTENKSKTIETLMKDWETSCFSNEKQVWNSIWHKNVRFASIIDYADSKVNCDYHWKLVSSEENTDNIFPWDKVYWTKSY